ncbi:MAG: hypothetical protein KAR14_12460, partial [Candidatus Aminicenantes bacterium]|nr:hypothetical protein [Candidatus Aminicenantes bacterium]
MNMKKSAFIVVFAISILLLSFNNISSGQHGGSIGNIQTGGAVSGNIYVSGFITLNSEKNEITASIILKN